MIKDVFSPTGFPPVFWRKGHRTNPSFPVHNFLQSAMLHHRKSKDVSSPMHPPILPKQMFSGRSRSVQNPCLHTNNSSAEHCSRVHKRIHNLLVFGRNLKQPADKFDIVPMFSEKMRSLFRNKQHPFLKRC